MNFPGQRTVPVLLENETDIKSVQLDCDIRPGRLWESYRIIWRRFFQSPPGAFSDITQGVNQLDFSLTLNVSKTTPTGVYRCFVEIQHAMDDARLYSGVQISLLIASECMHIAHEVTVMARKIIDYGHKFVLTSILMVLLQNLKPKVWLCNNDVL